MLQKSALESLYSGLVTLSTQLINQINLYLDKYDCEYALIKNVEGSVFSRPREDLTRARGRFAGNLGSSSVPSPLQTSRRIAVLKTKMLYCLDLFDCDQAFFFNRGRVILIHALLDYPIPPRKK